MLSPFKIVEHFRLSVYISKSYLCVGGWVGVEADAVTVQGS